MAYTNEKPEKKSYETPQLVVYGDVREITRHGTVSPNITDGGSVGVNRTG